MTRQVADQPPENKSVFIEKLVHGGWGLGRLPDGKVALVEGALPGEQVTLQLLQARGGRRDYVEATVAKVLNSVPERTKAPCPYYTECGGCNLQHASYSAQLRMKAEIVIESLQRAGISLAQDIVLPPLPSGEQFGYRYRLRLHLESNGNLGFHRRRSNRVVPINQCLLATAGINTVLNRVQQEIDLQILARQVEELEYNQCPESGRIFLVLHAKKQAQTKELHNLAAMLAPMADNVQTTQGLCLHPQNASEQTLLLHQHFYHSGLNYTLHWPAGSFFQVNSLQNENLVSLAMDAAAAPKRALDLFCGSGNFSIPMALLGAQVLGIEYSRITTRWARQNSKLAGLKNTRFVSGEAAKELAALHHSKAQFDTILLDPPRQGLGKAATLLPKLAPKRIVSISCDPATHARDLRLILAGGYRLLKVQPVDMFPQTHHIETMAILEQAGAD